MDKVVHRIESELLETTQHTGGNSTVKHLFQGDGDRYQIDILHTERIAL